MKNWLACFCLVLGFAFAAPADAQDARGAGDLYGEWRADFHRMVMESPDMSRSERDRAAGFVVDMEMTLEFARGGRLMLRGNMTGDVMRNRGTWTLDSADDQTLSVTANIEEENGTSSVQRMSVRFRDDDLINITDSRGEVIPFARVGSDDEWLQSSVPAASRLVTVESNWPEPIEVEASVSLLDGTWGANFEAMIARELMIPSHRAFANDALDQAYFNLTFVEDGTLLFFGALDGVYETDDGEWELESVEGREIVVTTETTNESGESRSERLTIEFITRDAVEMTDEEGDTILFDRL